VRVAAPLRIAPPLRMAPSLRIAPPLHSAPALRAAAPLHGVPGSAIAAAPQNWPHRRVPNPYQWPRWGWNYGAPWRATPCYWGSGFWGPWASLQPLAGSCYWNGSYWGPWGLSATAPVGYGSALAYDSSGAVPLYYPSYGVAPDSPGAELLYDYGLQQTDCNVPNLVVIWGPDNSVICAFPNDLVGPGNYLIDPDTLTLQSR
jgi:hypothetical protein